MPASLKYGLSRVSAWGPIVLSTPETVLTTSHRRESDEASERPHATAANTTSDNESTMTIKLRYKYLFMQKLPIELYIFFLEKSSGSAGDTGDSALTYSIIYFFHRRIPAF
jgi:hypothetical protein